MSDYMVRATAADGQIRAFAITSKEMTEEARVRHNSSPIVTAALGRAMSAAAMMGSMMKGEKDLLTLQIQGDGPMHGLTVTANANGGVKGYPGVHYFDNYHIEREAILPTSFCQGTSPYPLGMTIDIFEYQGKYEYDPSSVRYEILPGEQELMDNKPVDPSQLHMIAVTCPNCGASYKKAAGYAEKCPYCGSYQNT